MKSSIRARLHRVDLELFRAVARHHSPALDRVLPRLSRIANKSLLWGAVAGVLWMTGNRFGRRAALRGMMSVAATSTLVNGPAKLLFRRGRPGIDIVPLARRLRRIPTSPSFPSGHSASACAFAVGVATELPALAVPVGAVAGAVAYSRVYTGVHYPGDVLMGAAAGTAIALATRRMWPVAPREAAVVHRAFTPAQAPATTTGRGVAIAVNPAAGSGITLDPADELRSRLPEAVVEEVGEDGVGELRKHIERLAADATVVGVAGGDGSVNCAAQVALEQGKPLVIFPTGTLNHLARDLGLTSLGDAISALSGGDAVEIDVATIDGRVFLNTASFGSYVELVDARERLEKRIGKWPAVLFAAIRVLRTSQPVAVEIDGRSTTAWMAFIGNCRYHPSGFAPTWRERLDDRRLDIRIVTGGAPWARTRLILSIIAGKLGRSRVYDQRLVEEMEIAAREGALRLAHDGETFDGSERFLVKKHPDRLTVFAPSRT